MKLSSKTVTAIKMFIDLGEHYHEDFVPLKDIASRKNVSKKFLEQIVPIYKSNNLLIGNRGNQGGYKLAKSPSEITMKEIIYILESDLHQEKYGFLPIDNLLNQADNSLDSLFGKVTLNDLIEKLKDTYSYDYSI